MTRTPTTNRDNIHWTTDYATYERRVDYQLAVRFPLDQVSNIDENDIETVSDLCLFSTPVILRVWNRHLQSLDQQQVVNQRTRTAA